MPDEKQLLDVIASANQGILAAVTGTGYPHLTNILYTWDPAGRIARVSTTAERVKARILARDPRAALQVSGPHFWSYAVGECDAELTGAARTAGDATCRELLEVHGAFYGSIADEPAFSAKMIDERRLVVRLRVRRLYGVVLERPPGG